MNMQELKSELKGLKSELNDLLPHDVMERVLDTLGLQQRRPVRTTLSGAGLFVAGIIVGGTAALLLAPKTGIELRSDLEDKIDAIWNRVRHLRSGAGKEHEKENESEQAKSSGMSSKSDKDQTSMPSGQASKKEPRPSGTMPPGSSGGTGPMSS